MNAILASTSTLHSQDYLEYLIPHLPKLYKDVAEVIFIPYARPGGISLDEYTLRAKEAFAKADIKIKGVHEFEDPEKAIQNSEGVFTGGGNTFLLVSELYRNRVMAVLKQKIKSGTPYMGTSAGTNIGGLSMQTTNDMPIVYPPSFQTLGLVPFNINPHYLDPDPDTKHKGETRETRIKEFHNLNSPPVLGLREGSWLELSGNKVTLKGDLPARIFRKDQVPFEIETDSDLSDLN
ncbi:dipeptidase PepE [uncultured Christiangramia sp.]|uniref:dipeptidase PepE n=1 Tax=uncultured Christiangramia sp. TaxID=503836 RepID=UPI0025F17126|nr:dipeptidase PepE [uncultured Christiangramia sp.]|tara:strand:+ start:466 stop:1170 length:705 start_codon:yes stop_codon:yes gene_type:complete